MRTGWYIAVSLGGETPCIRRADDSDKDFSNRVILSSYSSGLSSSLVLNIANNSTVNDEPTLIALLKTPLVLQPLADQYDLSVLSLERKIVLEVSVHFVE